MKKNVCEFNKIQKFESIREMMELAVEQAGEKIAFEYRDDKDKEKIIKVTYKEFQNDTYYLGTALSKINMLNSHIAIVGDNSYKWINVYLTVLKTKGVFVPIDKELPYKDLVNLLENSDSEVLFYGEKFEKYIEQFKKDLPNIKYFIGLNKEDDGNVLSFDKFKKLGKEEYEKGDKSYVDIKNENLNELKMLVYTSGTTGVAKGVMLSEHNLVSSVYYGLQVADVETKCLSVLPYHHTYEAVSGILVGIHYHVTICINDSLKNVLKNLQLYKPDYIYLVPAFTEVFYKNIWAKVKKEGKEGGLKFLIGLSNFLRKLGIDLRKQLFKSIHEAFGGNLYQLVVGGAPIRPEIGKFFNDVGIMLLNGYGISECSPLVSVNRKNYNNDPATVGVILPCCEVDIRNKNEDGDGEIWVKGDIVMMGYYKNPEKTAKVMVDGWFNTEDYGRINDKGQLVINGRKKNVIVLNNGKNIYPEEIENYISSIPYVQDVIVKAVKNNQGEEIALCAETFLNKEAVEEMKTENIEEQLKKDISKATKELPSYKHIQKIEIRKTEFEKTSSKKIKR